MRKTRGGKGILIQTEAAATITALNNQMVLPIEGNGARPSHRGGGTEDPAIRASRLIQQKSTELPLSYDQYNNTYNCVTHTLRTGGGQCIPTIFLNNENNNNH